MKTLRRYPTSMTGFTVIELLVVIVIGSVLAISVVSMFVSQTRTMALNEDLVDLEQNLRISMDMLHRDVRMAGAYVKDAMPAFVLGPFSYYYEESGVNKSKALNSDGNPDAIMLNYSLDAGYTIKLGTSTSSSIKICNEIGAATSGLYIGNKIPVTNNGKIQFVEITNVTATGPGDCYNVVFSPGQSDINNSSGVAFDLTSPSNGVSWVNMNSIVYYIDGDFDGNGTSVLMRGVNNEPPAIVAFGITDLQVSYNPVAVYNSITSVDLLVKGLTRSAHDLSGVKQKRERSLTTEVLVRNLNF